MKKLALLALVALEICVCGCGNNPPTSVINTQSGNSEWEAQLTGGAGEDSLLNFVTQFSMGENGGTLTVNYVGLLNQSACFPPRVNGNGLVTGLTTNSSDQVTGTLTFTITSEDGPPNSTLTLTGNLTGTSSGSTSTTGNLTGGVVQGTWTLTSSDSSCNTSTSGTSSSPGGSFLMCQGAATCTVP
jgi:hypothetical protein